ncbi:hypothetical protein A33Q_4025 [Indibacter alkaliphilus LW1]|uniref:Uncharacterized protein n=1 Tax=Indibacter alkaliphilus (strain CCUG 57479 / KCTC 22604 / LW1) TaxID=1189612 RepID=S2CXN4_INDAL|nr:hypothetical protein [Indibacter alkaliphilus]EOZ91932.1 hypothetical protein A33Q_4025 [Indibacter alkaliphilus LW1]
MKKIFFSILAVFVLIIGTYFIWWNLPLTINRSSDIKLGEQIIEKIERYQKQNGLPDNNDWETLRKFGFRDKIDFLQPEYRKLSEDNFELIYVEGFDGPYLMWNSTERKWKNGYPTFDKPTENE